MKNLFILVLSILTFNCYANQVSVDENIKAIKSYIETLHQQDKFSGVVLITKDDNIVLKESYGYAHIGLSVANKPSTKFSFASIGKTFTAIAILQLLEQKKLSLSDTVGKFLPNYPNEVVRNSVTIQQLLNHTSGIPNYMTAKYYESSKDLYRNIDDLASLYQNEPLNFTPGAKFSYTNSGYVILGLIIEKLSGEQYDDYIKSHIFDVAGIVNTGNFDRDHPVADAAQGYTLSDIKPNNWRINTLLGSVKGGPAGGGFTTVDDLNAFVKALLSHKLLSKDTLPILLNRTSPEASYGNGMQFFESNGHQIFGHSGGHFGVGTEWSVYKDLGYKVFLLTNRDAEQGFYDVRYFIRKQLTGSTPFIESYLFTNEVIDVALNKGFSSAKELVNKGDIKLFESTINYKGYQLLSQKKFQLAIEMFNFQVMYFSDSFDAYDSLAEAYMEAGQIDLAIKNYQHSLKLNPQNKNAIDQLEKLKKR
ncbi:serine hydrolase domain-containing protein [Thalassotalea marina]|uniref:Beta-lactamase-related domain-containing protein n=1 Tax=Thalassotalea marina TaxID=1673741 RepID=A0A919EJP0_9GAMM|nr:serine hydrolase domain-containing protein [Thalassotalea marina]GHF92101.1 hypothetical protein GCM10017161_20190 [Thalassotalea marina]